MLNHNLHILQKLTKENGNLLTLFDNWRQYVLEYLKPEENGNKPLFVQSQTIDLNTFSETCYTDKRKRN